MNRKLRDLIAMSLLILYIIGYVGTFGNCTARRMKTERDPEVSVIMECPFIGLFWPIYISYRLQEIK